MSDSDGISTSIGHEDIWWAVERLQKLDQIFQKRQAQGDRSMVIGIIDLHYDDDLVEEDSTEPIGYRLKGRALALFSLLQRNFQMALEVADTGTVLDRAQKEDVNSVQFETMSEAHPERHVNAGYIYQKMLMLIASW